MCSREQCPVECDDVPEQPERSCENVDCVESSCGRVFGIRVAQFGTYHALLGRIESCFSWRSLS